MKYIELKTSVSPDEREHLVLQGWREQNIFHRSVEERPKERVFSFYEGPPTVNGTPGIHHVFSRTIKDTICRYKTMLGFRVERKAGWDTHGLPVEIAIEKELGFKHKREIEEYGVDKFNEKCKELVYSNIGRDLGWRELTERMGYWVNMDDPYITCTNDYVESVWWALKQFHDKGLIYKGFKIQPYCPRCETALSSHEVSLGYDIAKDPSVYVKFRRIQPPPNPRLEKAGEISKNAGEIPPSFSRRGTGGGFGDEEEFFLAWTTTPWTLLANIALAVHPDVEYVTVINKRKDKTERLILAEALIGKLEGDVEVVAHHKGKDLEGERYEPLFDYLIGNNYVEFISRYGDPRMLDGDIGNAFRVVADTYVSVEDGTGIVHQAPAFGEDDYRVSQSENPKLPLLITVGADGTIRLPASPYHGKFFKDADPDIMQELKQKGLLYRRETIEHTYPFCWRCDSPLLYYARDSWYIRVTEYKEKLISENQKINWQPPEIRDGRFGNWLEELKDWGLSRERFWGTPLPIWESGDGRVQVCIGSFDDFLRDYEFVVSKKIVEGEESGLLVGKDLKVKVTLRACLLQSNGSLRDITLEDIKNIDPHKPTVDKIYFKEIASPETRYEQTLLLSRTPEVIDVWFDSGSMPFAQHHFMEAGKLPPNYPADYISEGVDQTRGWFYTLHAINTFLFGEAPYRNVIVNDMLLDKQGQKMSKSKGNIVNPFDVMTKYGADATRWYLLSAAVPWKPRSFNEDDLGELERKLFGTLTNTYGFFALYANIDVYVRDDKKAIPIANRPEIDRWILSKLNSLIKECRENMDGYELTRPARAIMEFVMEQLSNWYIRRNRRRFWKGEQGSDKQAAYDTLYECLITVSKLMAPLAPFFSDWLYQALSGNEASVHLALYPEVDESAIDLALERRMESAQVISSLIRQMRERARIRVRQPLSKILIPVANRAEIAELRKVEEVIRDEVNVKHVEYVEAGDSDVIKLKAKANFKSLGAKLGKQMKAVAARVQKLSQEEIREYQASSSLSFEVDGTSVTLERGDVEVIAEDVEGWLVSSEGGITVALDTQMTPELQSEGIAREFVNRVQNLRKDSGFDVTDRIGIFVASDSHEILDAINQHSGFIQQETLAERILMDGAKLGDEIPVAEVEILDQVAKIQLVRAG